MIHNLQNSILLPGDVIGKVARGLNPRDSRPLAGYQPYKVRPWIMIVKDCHTGSDATVQLFFGTLSQRPGVSDCHGCHQNSTRIKVHVSSSAFAGLLQKQSCSFRLYLNSATNRADHTFFYRSLLFACNHEEFSRVKYIRSDQLNHWLLSLKSLSMHMHDISIAHMPSLISSSCR